MKLHFSLVEASLLRPWPGNVRELLIETRSAAQAALLQGKTRVESCHLGPNAGTAFGSTSAAALESRPRDDTPSGRAARPARPKAKPLDGEERARIEGALRQEAGNVTAAARALGMHRTHLRRLIERHEINIPDGADEA